MKLSAPTALPRPALKPAAAKNKRFTVEEKIAVLYAHATLGYSYVEIAPAIGLSVSTLKEWSRKFGSAVADITSPPKNGRPYHRPAVQELVACSINYFVRSFPGYDVRFIVDRVANYIRIDSRVLWWWMVLLRCGGGIRSRGNLPQSPTSSVYQLPHYSAVPFTEFSATELGWLGLDRSVIGSVASGIWVSRNSLNDTKDVHVVIEYTGGLVESFSIVPVQWVTLYAVPVGLVLEAFVTKTVTDWSSFYKSNPPVCKILKWKYEQLKDLYCLSLCDASGIAAVINGLKNNTISAGHDMFAFLSSYKVGMVNCHEITRLIDASRLMSLPALFTDVSPDRQYSCKMVAHCVKVSTSPEDLVDRLGRLRLELSTRCSRRL